MGLTIHTIAERPEFRNAMDEADSVAYPAFNLNSELAEVWDLVYEEFPEYQFVVCNDDGEPIAHGNSVPFAWNETYEDLPQTAVEMVQRALADRRNGTHTTTLGALQAVVHPAHQGGGLSQRVLEMMAGVAQQKGYPDLFAPIRPNQKHRYPLVSMQDYSGWTRADGLPLDAWLRVHHRLGATIAGVPAAWAVVTGTVRDWETWTGMVFPQSGTYVVPDALVPIEVDLERDEGRYVEPHLWMHYRIPLWEAENAAECLRRAPIFASLQEDSINRLAQLARVELCTAGSTIMKEGTSFDEAVDGLHVVMSGTLEVRKNGTGPERVLATLGAGEFFGETSLLRGQPRAASVVATEDTECLVLRRVDFVRQLERYPEISLRMLEALSDRLRELDGGLA